MTTVIFGEKHTSQGNQCKMGSQSGCSCQFWYICKPFRWVEDRRIKLQDTGSSSEAYFIRSSTAGSGMPGESLPWMLQTLFSNASLFVWLVCTSCCLFICSLFYILRESIFLEKTKMKLQKEILTHCSAKLCCLEKPCLGVAGHWCDSRCSKSCIVASQKWNQCRIDL